MCIVINNLFNFFQMVGLCIKKFKKIVFIFIRIISSRVSLVNEKYLSHPTLNGNRDEKCHIKF